MTTSCIVYRSIIDIYLQNWARSIVQHQKSRLFLRMPLMALTANQTSKGVNVNSYLQKQSKRNPYIRTIQFITNRTLTKCKKKLTNVNLNCSLPLFIVLLKWKFFCYTLAILFIFINNKESEWVTELRGTIYMYSLISTSTISEQEVVFIYCFLGFILHVQFSIFYTYK